MAVYAIGDVQGRYDALCTLLEAVTFDSGNDRLWLCGDLVNRGPQSLEVLRFVRGLGASAVAVLGNHDLHLLAVAEGEPALDEDTFHDVLDAADRDELLAWLRNRPLAHVDPELGFAMVHAGLPPQWDVEAAADRAREVEAALRGPDYRSFFDNMYGNEPDQWSEGLDGWDRLRFVTNTLTRLRYCDPLGRLGLGEKGPPGCQRPPFMPWFQVPGRRSEGQAIIFGHWATLQLHLPLDPAHGVFHLDTGCAWGGRLTALRLDDRRYFSVDCARVR